MGPHSHTSSWGGASYALTGVRVGKKNGVMQTPGSSVGVVALVDSGMLANPGIQSCTVEMEVAVGGVELKGHWTHCNC